MSFTSQYESFPSFTNEVVTYIEEEDEEEEEKKGKTEDGTDSPNSNKRENNLRGEGRLWIPDSIALACFSCEEPFNLFRRRHHCRVCGSVFCHPCSNFYIDGSLLKLDGTVRSCVTCSDQMISQVDHENASILSILTSENARFVNGFVPPRSIHIETHETEEQTDVASGELLRQDMRTHIEQRAASHLNLVMATLLSSEPSLSEEWKALICSLSQSIGRVVKPDVRRGDDMSINGLVHIEIVPGGKPSYSRLIHGTCFRHNPIHKKMRYITHKSSVPWRILLIRGGIDVQSEESKFTSLDKLMDLEDRAMEVLLLKILSLRPHVILAGGPVSHIAAERFYAHGVVVMQSVNPLVLLRVARVTGAEMLPSSQHIAHAQSQYGIDPIGRAGLFSMESIYDDPEHPSEPRAGGILKTKLSTNSSFVFIEGCEPRLGCAVFLRGEDRDVLERLRRLLQLATLIARHLDLQTDFLHNRDAHLPRGNNLEDMDSDSDSDMGDADVADKSRIISMSLDVSYGAPHMHDIRGCETLERSLSHSPPFLSLGLNTVSQVRVDAAQRSPTEKSLITFYGAGDLTLGQFLIEQCFQPSQRFGHVPALLNQTLSFAHTPGRIDISVNRSALAADRQHHPSHHVPVHLVYHLPIMLSLFCKECKSNVTSERPLSDDSWSLSFGTFLEMVFYNKSIFGSSYGCSHRSRENHLYIFTCVGLTTKFEFFPMHPFSILAHQPLKLPITFHKKYAESVLLEILDRSVSLEDEFKSAIIKLDQELFREIAYGKNSETLGILARETKALQEDISVSVLSFQDKLRSALSSLEGMNIRDCPTYFRFPLCWKRDLSFLGLSWNTQLEYLHSSFDDYQSRHRVDLVEPFSFFKSRQEPNDELVVAEEANVIKETSSAVLLLSDEDESSRLIPERSIEAIDICGGTVEDNSKQEAPSRFISTEPENHPRFEDRQSSISKAFALLLGTETLRERRLSVPLMDLSDSSLQMPPGRQGEVIEVIPSKPASVVAYFLASRFYCDQVSKLIRDEKLDLADDEVKTLFSSADEPTLGRPSPIQKEDYSMKYTHLKSDRFAPESIKELDDHQTLSITIPSPTGRNYGEESFLHGRIASPEVDAYTDNDFQHAVGHVSEGNDDATFLTDELTTSDIERQMLLQRRSHIKYKFRDSDGSAQCRYVCTAYWSTQFEAFRQAYFGLGEKDAFIRSLATSEEWVAQGGKSGAEFSKTKDGRFVIKLVSKTERIMFSDFAPAYFEYMSKALFHGLPTVLCKIFGVYQVGYHNLSNNKRVTVQLVVMENLFFDYSPSRVFDLKGSSRARYIAEDNPVTFEETLVRRRRRRKLLKDGSGIALIEETTDLGATSLIDRKTKVLLDDNFVQLNEGRPFPLKKRAKEYLEKAIINDSTFLSVINVVDYSILIGIDENSYCVRAGIIDFMRQYDFVKKMEHMSKSVGMLTGQAEPTIIEPQQYKRRFQSAIERYFFEVSDAWNE